MRSKTAPPKSDKRAQAQEEFAQVLENIGVRGFYGTASVTVQVQDGHVQSTRVVVERLVR